MEKEKQSKINKLKVKNPLEYALAEENEDEYSEVIDGELVIWPKRESPEINVFFGDITVSVIDKIEAFNLDFKIF